MIKVIPIRKKPTIILITKFSNENVYYHYHLLDIIKINKYCDIGCWHVKYKALTGTELILK